MFLDALSVMQDRRARLSTVRKQVFKAGTGANAPGHSHPVAARSRREASKFLGHVARELQSRRYDISISSREAAWKNTVGSRQYRVGKDLLADSSVEELKPGDFVTMVDTEYYMSEAEVSRYAGHDIGIFGLRPDGLSNTTEDSSWSFVNPGEVVEEVAGGAVYRHQVWDWSKDCIALGRWFSTYIYDVVEFSIAPGRVVTVLVLARVVRLPIWLTQWVFPDVRKYRMSRMVVTQQGRFLVGQFGHVSKRQFHVKKLPAVIGEDDVRLSPNLFSALAEASAIPNTDRKVARLEILPAGVERIARQMKEELSGHGHQVLSAYFTNGYTPQAMVNYQSKGGLDLEDGVPTASLAAVPLAGSGCAPTSSENNEVRAVQARILDIANKTRFSAELVEYGKEFAELVVPKEHQGVPFEMAELRSEQDRPTQRARRLEEEQFSSDRGKAMTTSSFQKRETYPKPGDPRLINQVKTDHTNRLCSYSGAIKRFLKGSKASKWYMVGSRPDRIAKALRGLQKRHGKRLVGGDYSRMDGRTTKDHRLHVLRPVYQRFFAPMYHAEIEELLAKENAAVTRTKKFKVKASMGGANLSGSGITTDLNTLDAAFNEYVARRRMGDSPAQAYSKLGCYFGDDSVVGPDVFEKVVLVAKEVGMDLKKEDVPGEAGDGYVVFLSRVYPDIRTSLASHPCIVRALRKLCTVAVGPKASKDVLRLKLAVKVAGALTSDSHVPLYAEYAKALQRVYVAGKVTEAAIAAEGKVDSSYRSKIHMGPYPYAEGDEEVLVPSIAMGLGLSVEELTLLRSRLEAATSEQDLTTCSLPGGVELPEWARWVPTPTADI